MSGRRIKEWPGYKEYRNAKRRVGYDGVKDQADYDLWYATWKKENCYTQREKEARWLAKLSSERLEQIRQDKLEYHRSNPIRHRLNAIKTRSKKKGFEFNLTEEWFLAHFNICEVTKLELEWDHTSPWHPEVDRIDPTKGYTMDNCRLVCAIYNRSRMVYKDQEVVAFAKLMGNEARLLHM